MKGRNDYKNDHVSKFCALLVDACIFAPHIVTKFLSTIYVENKKLKEDADSNIRDLHNFNAENLLFKLIWPVLLEPMLHCYAHDEALKNIFYWVPKCVMQGYYNQIKYFHHETYSVQLTCFSY